MTKKIKIEPKKINKVKSVLNIINEEFVERWIEEVDLSLTPLFYGIFTTKGEYCVVCRNIGFDFDHFPEVFKKDKFKLIYERLFCWN